MSALWNSHRKNPRGWTRHTHLSTLPKVKQGTKMIIGLTGNNSFGLKQRLNKLTSIFIKEHGELALERLDADEVESAVILKSIQSLPFLANRKMVILRGLGANSTTAEAIEQIIDAVGD